MALGIPAGKGVLMGGLDPRKMEAWSDGHWVGGHPPGLVHGFGHDTRTLQAGACFVALKTGVRDGHDFLEQARAAGACAALVSRPVPGCPLPQLVVENTLRAFQAIARRHRRAFSGKVLGVTGSCGKTTTKDLSAALLGPRTLRTDGNFNNEIGVPLTLTRLDAEQHDFAVVEAGINEPGEMEVLASMIQADAVIVTMVGPAHLEKLGSVGGVAREKARLADPESQSPLFCPADCLRHEAFLALGSRVRAIRRLGVSTPPAAECQWLDYDYVQEEEQTVRVTLYTDKGSLVSVVPFVTPGLISNAVLAMAAADYLGVAQDELTRRMSDWQPGRHRGHWLEGDGVLVYDDAYNANPASMAEALEVFVRLAPAGMPRCFVLAGMRELGEDSGDWHRKTGRSLSWREGDRVLLVGQEALYYRDGLREAGVSETCIDHARDIAEAGDLLFGFRGAVFLKGSRAFALEGLLPVLLPGKEAVC